jgi:hypothetical protein
MLRAVAPQVSEAPEGFEGVVSNELAEKLHTSVAKRFLVDSDRCH